MTYAVGDRITIEGRTKARVASVDENGSVRQAICESGAMWFRPSNVRLVHVPHKKVPARGHQARMKTGKAAKQLMSDTVSTLQKGQQLGLSSQ